MIEVSNLTKKYGDHIAVDHLSFRVEKGQIYGFLGPNGAGKSTTMNIITGYLAATEGTVTIDGKDVQKDPEEAKRAIGFDRSGTTRIGKFVLNHSFMLPGLTGVFTACVAGFVIAHILY